MELSDIRVGDRVIEGRHDGMVTRIMAGTPYRQIGPYAMIEWGNGAYTSTPIANLTIVARAVYMTPERIAALQESYEVAEAFAAECDDPQGDYRRRADSLKAMLAEAKS